MQQLPGRRALALAVALTFAAAGSAFAQDTTDAGAARFDTTDAGAGAIDTAAVDTSAQMDRDTSAVNDTTGAAYDTTGAATDTSGASGVQNPPGYRGMERDTTMFPAEGGPPASPEEAAGQTTGVYGDSAAGEHQNPPGYRGMERPAGIDSAAAGHDTSHGTGTGAGDTTGMNPDSSQ